MRQLHKYHRNLSLMMKCVLPLFSYNYNNIMPQYSKVHVARWEEGKRWQKRVESLKAKLKKKTTELEAATVQISTLERRISGLVSYCCSSDACV